MKTVILTLETVGASIQEIVTVRKSESKIISEWKSRYGKMFYKCTVSVIDDKKKGDVDFDEKSKDGAFIVNLKNGQQYANYKEAIRKTGLSHNHIYRQCKRMMYVGYKYYLKYA